MFDIVHHDLKDFGNVILELINKIEPNLKQELIESFIEDNIYLDFIVDSLKDLNND